MDQLRNLVGEMSTELAFRRSLTGQAIPFQVHGATPFTHPDRYDVSLGGHHCKLDCTLISRREQICQDPQRSRAYIECPSSGSQSTSFRQKDSKPDDMHIFALSLGLTAVTSVEVDKARAAGQPTCLIHPLPDGWRCPRDWLPLEKLALKSECELPISIEIGGQNREREFSTARLDLLPKKRVVVEQCFHSLAYLQASLRPESRIGLHSPTRGEAHIISPPEWGNIWVYGMEILLMGWLSHEEYRRKAKVLNAGMRTFQIEQIARKKPAVPMEELNPLRPLFRRIQDWAAKRK